MNQRVLQIKGLAIIGVLFAHMYFANRFSVEVLYLIEKMQDLFGWCVICFFFASGLLHKDTSRSDFGIYFKNRFNRLIVTSIVFSITYKGLFLFLGYCNIVTNASVPLKTWIDFLAIIFSPVGPQFYFLYYLFAISLIVVVLRLLIHERIYYISSVVLFLALSFIFNSPAFGYGSDVSLLPVYFISYHIGILFKEENVLIDKPWILIGIILAIIFPSIYYQTIVYIYILVPPALYYIIGLLPEKFFLLRILSYIGINSSSIYVYHAPILMPLLSIVLYPTFNNSYAFIILFTLSIIVSCILLKKLLSLFRVFKIWVY